MEIFLSMYSLVAFGAALGLATVDIDRGEERKAVIIIGAMFLGALWPAYWAVKIAQILEGSRHDRTTEAAKMV